VQFVPAANEIWYDVPPGSRKQQCESGKCGAVFYWVRNPKTGRMVPVDCDVVGGHPPSDTNDPQQTDAFGGTARVFDGRGISHFRSCAEPDRFRRK
jgi:hypothetical protein